MPRLRVLHVTPYYENAWGYGGIPRAVTALAHGQARRGDAVTVATTDAGDATARATASPGGPVEAHLFPNISNALAYHRQLFLPRGLSAWLREHIAGFDVVHVHGCRHLPGVLAARHAERAGVPWVLSPHGTAPRIERRRLAKLLFDVTLGRGFLARAARVLAVSDAEARTLRRLGVAAAALRTVGNPIDTAAFAPAARGRWRAARGLGDRPLVLFLGKLTVRKRVDVLIDAVAALARPDVTLVVAGNDLGAGAAARRRARRRGLAARTIFTGLLRGDERLDALADADVVVYPSRDEVFGLVPLEALLCGTPVIVADDSGCGEIVARTGGGVVVGQGDVAALARALARVLADGDGGRGAARAARARIAGEFGVDAVCARVDDVYRELAARDVTDARAGALTAP